MSDSKLEAKFQEGFDAELEKIAALSDILGNAGTIALNGKDLLNKAMYETAGKAVAGTLAGVLTGAAMYGAAKAKSGMDTRSLHSEFQMALNKVVQGSRVVQQANREKVHSYAETIFKFAPHIATDPNILGQILSNAVVFDGLDPSTIKTLQEMEARHQDNTSIAPGLKNMVVKSF